MAKLTNPAHIRGFQKILEQLPGPANFGPTFELLRQMAVGHDDTGSMDVELRHTEIADTVLIDVHVGTFAGEFRISWAEKRQYDQLSALADHSMDDTEIEVHPVMDKILRDFKGSVGWAQ